MMEDIGQLSWMRVVLEKAKFIVRFVTSKPKVLNIFRANSSLQFQKPSATRFCYMFLVLERVLRVRKGLLRTVVAEEWYSIQEVKSGDTLYTQFSNIVMGDEQFWKKGEIIMHALKPLHSVLRITDMEGSTLGLIYEYVDRIGECIEKIEGLMENE
ncbi:hypothetical protein KP509_32G036300 [Ceratopteris richardii]|uniref:Uncharacterized protein n=1 Tax=Ceratopteris richardii TaxID=49495 RepID=A0A8T2QUR3_CERRI|nr:hypothetical protein KP509_32G036300 [Ceratopteris richardii]